MRRSARGPEPRRWQPDSPEPDPHRFCGVPAARVGANPSPPTTRPTADQAIPAGSTSPAQNCGDGLSSGPARRWAKYSRCDRRRENCPVPPPARGDPAPLPRRCARGRAASRRSSPRRSPTAAESDLSPKRAARPAPPPRRSPPATRENAVICPAGPASQPHPRPKSAA